MKYREMIMVRKLFAGLACALLISNICFGMDGYPDRNRDVDFTLKVLKTASVLGAVATVGIGFIAGTEYCADKTVAYAKEKYGKQVKHEIERKIRQGVAALGTLAFSGTCYGVHCAYQWYTSRGAPMPLLVNVTGPNIVSESNPDEILGSPSSESESDSHSSTQEDDELEAFFSATLSPWIIEKIKGYSPERRRRFFTALMIEIGPNLQINQIASDTPKQEEKGGSDDVDLYSNHDDNEAQHSHDLSIPASEQPMSSDADVADKNASVPDQSQVIKEATFFCKVESIFDEAVKDAKVFFAK